MRSSSWQTAGSQTMFPRLEKHISMLSALHKRRNLYSYNWVVQLVDISAKVLLIVSVCTVCLWNVSLPLSAKACGADHLQWGCSVVRLAEARHIQLPRVQ